MNILKKLFEPCKTIGTVELNERACRIEAELKKIGRSLTLDEFEMIKKIIILSPYRDSPAILMKECRRVLLEESLRFRP